MIFSLLALWLHLLFTAAVYFIYGWTEIDLTHLLLLDIRDFAGFCSKCAAVNEHPCSYFFV